METLKRMKLHKDDGVGGGGGGGRAVVTENSIARNHVNYHHGMISMDAPAKARTLAQLLVCIQ